MINQNGIANILVDVAFLETEFQKLGKAQLAAVFTELRVVSDYRLSFSPNIPVNSFDSRSPFVFVDDIDTCERQGIGVSPA